MDLPLPIYYKGYNSNRQTAEVPRARYWGEGMESPGSSKCPPTLPTAQFRIFMAIPLHSSDWFKDGPLGLTPSLALLPSRRSGMGLKVPPF